MTLETWIAFATIKLVYSLTPGPNAMAIAAASGRAGLRGGLSALGGVLLAESIWVGLALFVVLGMLEAAPVTSGLMELLGMLLMIALGAQMLLRRSDPALGTNASAPSHQSIFAKAFAIALSNPLTIVFFVTVVPIFLGGEGSGPVTGGLAVGIVTAAGVSCCVAHAPYLAAAGLQSIGPRGAIERVCGAILIVFALMRVVA